MYPQLDVALVGGSVFIDARGLVARRLRQRLERPPSNTSFEKRRLRGEGGKMTYLLQITRNFQKLVVGAALAQVVPKKDYRHACSNEAADHGDRLSVQPQNT